MSLLAYNPYCVDNSLQFDTGARQSIQNYADEFYNDHELYQYLGIYQNATAEQIQSALRKKQALMATLESQHKDIREMARLYSRANACLTHPVNIRAYELFGDMPQPTTALPPPSSTTPPPRVSSSRTHFQRSRQPPATSHRHHRVLPAPDHPPHRSPLLNQRPHHTEPYYEHIPSAKLYFPPSVRPPAYNPALPPPVARSKNVQFLTPLASYPRPSAPSIY